jgi:hypothetical protein
MRFGRSRLLLDALLLVTVVFGILVVGRLLALFLPLEYYFTFESLFTDRTPTNIALALLGKAIAPVLVGFGCGWLVYDRALASVSATSSFAGFRRRLRIQWSPTVFLGGFLAAFLSAWPMMLYWDLLANPAVLHLKALFFLLYVVYMLSFGYVTLAGFLGAVFMREHLSAEAGKRGLVSIAELSRVGVLWLVTSGAASAAMEVLVK